MQDQRHLDSNANRSICGLATFLAPCVFVYYVLRMFVCVCVFHSVLITPCN